MSSVLALLLLAATDDPTTSADPRPQMVEVVTAYLRAWQQKDWPKVVALTHPIPLNRFKAGCDAALKNQGLRITKPVNYS